MKLKINRILIGLFMFSFAVCVGTAHAEIRINPDFEGTLVITTPDGNIILLEPGDEIPEILSGSLLEVFDGYFTVETDPGDSVQILCLGHEISVGDGSSISLSSAEEAGSLSVLAGSVSLVTPAGDLVDLNIGDDYQIQLEEDAMGLLPTAKGVPPSFSNADDEATPPVDSRGVDVDVLVPTVLAEAGSNPQSNDNSPNE